MPANQRVFFARPTGTVGEKCNPLGYTLNRAILCEKGGVGRSDAGNTEGRVLTH